jgi:hypothetical protein
LPAPTNRRIAVLVSYFDIYRSNQHVLPSHRIVRLEYGPTPALSAKIEYLYITAVLLDVSSHGEIRAGLTYRFGGM